jgi:hypothetical protein
MADADIKQLAEDALHGDDPAIYNAISKNKTGCLQEKVLQGIVEETYKLSSDGNSPISLSSEGPPLSFSFEDRIHKLRRADALSHTNIPLVTIIVPKDCPAN